MNFPLKFDNSQLIILLNRFLIDLNFPLNYSQSPWTFLPLLIQLSKEFLESPLYGSNDNIESLFHFMFANIINLCICCFKKIVSFPNIEDIKKHLIFIKNTNKKEKTISVIFNNQLNDEDFDNFVNLMYSKVPNILNKRLSHDDIEFEKTLLLALIYKTHEINNVIAINNQIKNKGNIQILPSIKTLIQEIYKIRSYIRLKKQNNATEYIRIVTNYNEKAHFLLRSSTQKIILKKIFDFFNDDIHVSELIKEKNELELISERFVISIKMMNDFLKQDFPTEIIMLFMNHVFNNFDIFSLYELNFELSDIYLEFSINIIRNILKCLDHISMNYVIHFIINYLALAINLFKPEDIHDIISESIKSVMTKICKESNKMSRKLFKVYVSIFSHFNKYLLDEKCFTMEQNERTKISQIITEKMDLKCSMSLTFNHSLLLGQFSISQTLDHVKSILGYVNSNEFHRVSLILFDYLQLYSFNKKENDFLHLLSFIMDIIGKVVSGSQSEYLLQSAIQINNIEKGIDKAFVRASKSQISCILELIQIIRKLMVNKETDSALMIKKHFIAVIEHFRIENFNDMKQVYSILAILSNNIFKIMRPNIIVKTNDNSSYYIESINENEHKLEVIKIPVLKGEIIRSKIDFSDISEFHEPIELDKHNFNIISILLMILKKVIKIETNNSSFSLLSFLLFENIKENIKDYDQNNEFHDLFLSLIKNKQIKQFRFSNKYSKTILSLLEKLLMIQTEGVFTNSPIKAQMNHAAFTKLVFDDDFILTNSKLQAKKSPHVFVSSILNNEKPMYFCVKYENNQQIFNFGIIVHSIKDNSTTILYSLNKLQFLINGERIIDYKLELNNSIECCFSPQDNIISFSDSDKKSIIFSCDLDVKSKCSFIISIHPGTTINYSLDVNPHIECFLTKPNENNRFKLKYNNQENKIIEFSPTMNINKLTDQVIDLKSLFSLSEFNYMTQSNVYLENYQNAYSNSSIENISSSPIQLESYLRIQNISGEFDLIDKDQSSFEPVNFIPSFSNDNYYYLPPEILNYYIKEACEFHREKIFMLLTKNIIVKTMDNKAIENLFPSMPFVINFITSALFLLDPIYFYHLYEEKCPIDFVSCNNLEKCHKSNMYDYFIAIKKILEHFNENNKDLLINKWFNKLKEDFNNKFLHFCSQNNENLKIVKSSIVDSYQYFNVKNAIGWIVFPYKFGCFKLPSMHIDKVFPKSFDEHQNYIYCCKETLKIKANYKFETSNDLIPFGILPLFDNSNKSLLDSFYYLVISFKYFVLFSKNHLSNETKNELWEMVFNPIMAGSPFFYSHSKDVFSFLYNQIQFSTVQLPLLYLLNAFNNTIKNKSIQHFINMILFNNNIEVAKKYADDIFNNTSISKKTQFPNEIIPKKLNSFSHLKSILKVILQIFSKDDSKEFPIYLFVREWIEAFIYFPPCHINVVKPNILKIEFTVFTPINGISLYCKEKSYSDIKLYYSSSIDFNESSTNSSSVISHQLKDSKILYVRFPENEDISDYNFIIDHSFYSFQYDDLPKIILEYKSSMLNDIKILFNEFTADEDCQILSQVYYPNFFGDEISTRISAFRLKNLNKTRHPTHLVYLRGIYLIATNYIFVNEKFIKNYGEIEKLKKLLDINILTIGFMNLIDSKSSDKVDTLNINRQEALDYRKGLNKNEEKSMIAQFSKEYFANPDHFRNTRTPFKIIYENESGYDAGGLMRDYITEIIKDINTSEIGLFIQTPNGRNKEGNNQECIIPNPLPDIKNSAQYYHAIGAFFAIIIRSNMKQTDLIFPPLFWEFIADAKLTIDDIYSIDNSYQKITSNLLQEFKNADNTYNLKISSISVLNMRGNVIKIDQFDFISKSNYEEFIERCNEIRLNELRNPLFEIRSGFWENLNFDPPVYINGPFLESLICNEKFTTVEELKKQILFENVPEIQQEYFWEVVSRMNKDEIKKLIQFSTGLTSLGSDGLTIIAYVCDTDTHLPTASTCFFKLNLPPFSSAEKMYNAFITAINETSTFEKA